MYYLFFIIYILAGFTAILALFLWALRNGQFKDQQRARFLPLEEEGEDPPARVSRLNRYQAFGLFAVMGSGLLASTLAVLYSLFF